MTIKETGPGGLVRAYYTLLPFAQGPEGASREAARLVNMEARVRENLGNEGLEFVVKRSGGDDILNVRFRRGD